MATLFYPESHSPTNRGFEFGGRDRGFPTDIPRAKWRGNRLERNAARDQAIAESLNDDARR